MNYYKYYTEIEEAFIRRRGKHLILGTIDWDLMQSWEKKGVPLRIILNGIETVFDGLDKSPMGSKNVRSLSYCKGEIESQYEKWLANQIGKSDSTKPQAEKVSVKKSDDPRQMLFSSRVIEEHLESIISGLERSKAKSQGGLRQLLEETLETLKSQKINHSEAESLEDLLEELERRIDKKLLETLDEKSLLSLTNKIEKDLLKSKIKIGGESYQKTLDLMINKSLREDFDIPRLSLFYL